MDRCSAPSASASASGKVKMQPTRFYQVIVPPFVQGGDVPSVARGTSVPMRVQIRNPSPVVIFLSDTLADLTQAGGPTGQVYRLPAGDRDVFILAPEQNLYAMAGGPAGVVAVALSDAIPVLI